MAHFFGVARERGIEIQEQGIFRERKHANLSFTAVRDALKAVEHIAAGLQR